MLKIILKILKYIIIFAFSITSLGPYIIMLISSFNNSVNIRRGTIFNNISVNQFIDNAQFLFKDPSVSISFKNTIIITLFTVLISIFISSITGYLFTIAINRKIIKRIYILNLISIMIPSMVTLIPLFILLRLLHLLNNLGTIVLVSLSVPLISYLFKKNSELFPYNLIKSARIDGLSELKIFFLIYVPNMIPVFICASALLFIETWNSFLFPLIIIQSQNKMVMSIFINSYGNSYTTNYGAFMVLLLLASIPPLLLFIFTRKYFLKGLSTFIS